MNFFPSCLKPIFPFLHPLFMLTVLGLTLYTLYLGVQIIRLRSASREMKKVMASSRFPLRHYQMGSFLLTLMVLGSLGGMAANYLMTKRLFLSPHLLVGLGMTSIIAISASLVSLMRGGNRWARPVHLILNLIFVCLFLWQAATGTQIVKRILNPPQVESYPAKQPVNTAVVMHRNNKPSDQNL